MYTLYKSAPQTGTHTTVVKRISDGAFIPMDERNTDYQEYLKWLAEGNEPQPADEGQ